MKLWLHQSIQTVFCLAAFMSNPQSGHEHILHGPLGNVQGGYPFDFFATSPGMSGKGNAKVAL